MKVIDFLKMFEILRYDNHTELHTLLVNKDGSVKFLQIEDVCNNASPAKYNEIGIVLTKEEER